jgi:hypothetical protein
MLPPPGEDRGGRHRGRLEPGAPGGGELERAGVHYALRGGREVRDPARSRRCHDRDAARHGRVGAAAGQGRGGSTASSTLEGSHRTVARNSQIARPCRHYSFHYPRFGHKFDFCACVSVSVIVTT